MAKLAELSFDDELPELAFEDDTTASSAPFIAPQGDGLDMETKAVMGGGAAAAGFGAYLLSKPYLEEWKDVNPQLRSMQGQLGISKAEEGFIPMKLRGMEQDVRTAKNARVKQLEYDSKQTVSQLKRSLTDFDNNILSKNIEELSQGIISEYPAWKNTAYNSYDKFLDVVDGAFNEKDVKFSVEDFKTNAIDKTLTYAEKRGYTPQDLKALTQLKRAVTSQLSADKDKMLSYREMRGYINSIQRNNKLDGNVIRVFKENWGGMIEKYAPDEIKPYIKEVNTEYKDFAQVRDKLDDVVTKAGTADTTKMVRYLREYVKSNIETGTQRVMSLLGEGNKIVGKIQGVGKSFEDLKSAKGQRTQKLQSIQKEQEGLVKQLSDIETSSRAEVDRLSKLRLKATELLSQKSKLQSRQFLNPLKVAGRVLNPMVRGALKAVGPIGAVTQAVDFSNNPTKATLEMMGLPVDVVPPDPNMSERAMRDFNFYQLTRMGKRPES